MINFNNKPRQGFTIKPRQGFTIKPRQGFTIKPQQGFTLVELLVGAAIGLFLVAVIISSYLSTKQTYNITQSVSRIQEDSRFAQYFIGRDLRETNNLGCLKAVRNMLPATTNLTDLNINVGGWEYSDTSPGDDVNLTGTYANSTTRNDWTGLNNGINQQLPANINSISLSDSILIKKITPIEGATVTSTADNSTINLSGYTPSIGDVLIVGNCFRADQFEVDSIAGITITPAGGADFGADWDENSRIFSVSHVNYHVGLRAGAESPSLYRKDSLQAQAEELVESVESLQALYGLDSNDDGFANQYLSANDVTAAQWPNIVSLRVGILYLAPNGKDGNSAALTQNYDVADGTNFIAAVNDRDLRYVVNSTINTRNLGLAAKFSVCDAGDVSCDLNGFEEITP